MDGQDILIHAADEGTIGEYFCTATNEFGRGHADPVHLSVTDGQQKTHPHIIQQSECNDFLFCLFAEEEPPTARVEPKVWNGQPGARHQFKCYVSGNPHPTIQVRPSNHHQAQFSLPSNRRIFAYFSHPFQWTGPGGEELPEGVVDLGDGVLEISNASKELHEGEYTCTATNPLGEASDTGRVNVNPSIDIRITTPPEDKPAPARLKLIVGEPLEVKCEATGEPDPDVEWLQSVPPHKNTNPTKSPHVSSAVIRDQSAAICPTILCQSPFPSNSCAIQASGLATAVATRARPAISLHPSQRVFALKVNNGWDGWVIAEITVMPMLIHAFSHNCFQ